MSAPDHRSEFARGTTVAGRHKRGLLWALALNSGLLILEVVGGLWTGSLALLADAGHMLTDVSGVTMSLLAIWFAQKPPTLANTYGYFRTEILASMANGTLLFIVAGYILEAISIYSYLASEVKRSAGLEHLCRNCSFTGPFGHL